MKREIRKFVRRFGFDIIKIQKDQMGVYPFYDMAKFVKSNDPVFFDIGANIGQTVKDIKEVFKNATIHAFEPSPNTFEILQNNTSNFKKLYLWNFGVGSSNDDLLLNEYAFSNLNSFFDIHNYEFCKLKGKTLVKTTTVDQFVIENSIQMIDVLKIDTEGFELEVFKGAINSIKESKIGMLFFEASFVARNKDMPSFTELWDFAIQNEFELVSIYPLVHRKNMGVYTNILFKHKNYQ
jgi:FkbM family methyltransferase